MSKIIKLSVNPEVVKSKEEGKIKTKYEIRSFDIESELDRNSLDALFHTNNYALNSWRNGKRASANYTGLLGIALDYDDGKISLETAKNLFKPFINIIHTTTSNRNNDQGNIEKFRVILPFNLSNGDVEFPNYNEVTKVYELLKTLYPEADCSCFEAARHFIPFTGKNDDNYECHINSNGDWFEIDRSKLKNINISQPLSNHTTFTLNTTIILAKDAKWDGNQWSGKQNIIRDIDKHTAIFCPFCNDLTNPPPHGASAFIDINGHGVHYIFCSHCKSITGNGTYWLDEKDKIESVGLFTFRTFDGRYFIRNSEYAFQEFNDRSQINVEFIKAGIPAPTIIDNYGLVLDYSSNDFIVENNGFKIINLYRPTKVMKITADSNVNPSMFPTIWAWSKHLCPSNDVHSIFIQWLARIVKDRIKLRTSWIFMGRQGCGKTKFFELVVGGIIGEEYLSTVTNDQLKEKYNNYLTDGVFHIYEEIACDKSDRVHVKSKIKLHVTEDKVPIREMWSGTKQRVKVISNCVFLSNEDTPIELDTPDRRFNVVRCTEQEIKDCSWYVENLRPIISTELPYFVAYLKALPITWDVMNKTIDNAEKRKLQEQVLEHKDIFWKALYDADSNSLHNIYEPPSAGFGTRTLVDFANLQMKMSHWKKQGYVEEVALKKLLDELFVNHKKYGIGITKLPHYFSRSSLNSTGQKVLKFK